MLVKLIASSFLIRLVNVGLMAISTFILAKVLTPAEFGIYSLAISYVAIIVIPLQSGIPILTIREISSRADNLIPRDLVRFSFNIIFRFFLLVCLIDFALNLLSSSPITEFRLQFYIVAVATVIMAVLSGYIQGMNHILQSQYIEQLLRPLLLILFIVFILYQYVHVVNYKIALYLLALSYICSCIAAVFYLYRGKYFNKDKIENDIKNNWYKSLIPLCSLTGLQVLLSQMDIIILANIDGYDSVGVYKIATQFAIVVTLISTVVGAIIGPKINKLYYTDIPQLEKIIQTSNWIGLLSSMIILGVFFFFGEYVITRILGVAYSESSSYLLVLCLGYVISSLFGPISTIVNMLSLEKMNLLAILFAVITNLILLIILVPKFGGMGAALSTALSIVLWKMFLTYLVKDKIKIRCYFKIKG